MISLVNGEPLVELLTKGLGVDDREAAGEIAADVCGRPPIDEDTAVQEGHGRSRRIVGRGEDDVRPVAL
jgi:hypothetical protein